MVQKLFRLALFQAQREISPKIDSTLRVVYPVEPKVSGNPIPLELIVVVT